MTVILVQNSAFEGVRYRPITENEPVTLNPISDKWRA